LKKKQFKGIIILTKIFSERKRYNMKEFTINRNDSGQRVDKFLEKAVPKLPKSLMYKYIRIKRIKLNGKRCEISTKLQNGDVMQLYINDEFFGNMSDKELFMSAPCEVDTVYEDENIILCNKPVGLVVHEDESGSKDTLINRVKHYLYEKGEYDPEKENSFAPALCNRIDRNTGGIVICAKNAESLRILNQKVKDRELEKLYLCVTVGIPAKGSGEIRGYIERDEKEKRVKVGDRKTENSRTAVTKYRVVAENREKNIALVEADLVTGRTHQIRAQFAHEGYPLLGDGKYGNGRVNRAFDVKGQALCAYKLTFKFTSESGCLEYLNGKSFSVNDVWFKRFFLK
jgi:23S rRNA pseudouridine955/2504/2580 synthase